MISRFKERIYYIHPDILKNIKMINIIVGMTKEKVIGKNNTLPWHIPEDLQNFKKLTDNTTVIMGRKTYQSLPPKFRPLPNRHNVVVSRTLTNIEEIGVDICPSIESALEKAKSYGKKIFFIGGTTIYRQALPFTERMYISYVKKNYEGDTYFPEFDQKDWNIESRQDFEKFELVVYRRK